jgi:sorbitol/mannitol transport system substrate-binding protein
MFAAAGLEMPEQLTWDQIREFACQPNDPANNSTVLCYGSAGLGRNHGPVDTVVNTFGGRWFDENWEPQLTSPEWNDAVAST